jgi:hypothetical protein
MTAILFIIDELGLIFQMLITFIVAFIQMKRTEENYGILEQALLKKARKEYSMLKERFI